MGEEILIISDELQQKVLDYINSEEFDKMVDSTVFKDDANGRNAIIHGMVIASMLTCRCKKYCAYIDKDNAEESNIKEK